MPDAPDQVQFDCTCSLCGSTLPVGARFCRRCGGNAVQTPVSATVARQAEDRCSACGVPRDPAAKYCGTCGAVLPQSIRPTPQQPDAEPAQAQPAVGRMRSPSHDDLERRVERRNEEAVLVSSTAEALSRASPKRKSIAREVRREKQTPTVSSVPPRAVNGSGPRSRRLSLSVGVVSVVLVVAAALLLLDGTSSRHAIQSVRPATLDPESPDVQQVIGALKRNDGGELYRVVSREITASSQARFASSIQHQRAMLGAITTISASGPSMARLQSDGGGIGFLLLHIGYKARAVRTYKAYFLHENGHWRLLATLPLQ